MQTSVPPDLGEMKDTIILGLTGRQLVFFSMGAVIGLPVFYYSMTKIGSSNAALVMLVVMAPFFLLGIYTRHGYSADKLLVYKLKYKREIKRRLYISYEERINKEKLVRKEVENLEKEVGGTFIFKCCRILYKSKKVSFKIWKKIEEFVLKKPY